MTGTVDETYHAALQHDLVDVGDATRVGVVRRPTPWFHGTVDENHRALGPPDDLIDALDDEAEELKLAGLCDEEAHNAAWDAVDFESRYRDHLDADPDAKAAVDDLADRVRAGEDLVLVCFEGDDKHCHRHALLDVLRSRTSDAA